MAASVQPFRRLAVEGWNLRELGARAGRALTTAIEGSEAPVSELDGHECGLSVPARLRIATFVALATGVLFLPVEANLLDSNASTSLLLLYVFHALFMSTVLITSFTAAGERHADRLALILVLGHAANLHAYLYIWPTYPGLVGGVLTGLLVGSSVLFSWRAGRVLVLSAAVCTAFLLIGVAVAPGGVLDPSFVVAWTSLAVGGATAIGCARLILLLRASLTERQCELTDLSNRLMSVQEEERRRLARDLHDEFGQSLTAVNAYLWLIERHAGSDTESLRSRTAEARRVVAKTLASMRELSHLLRPSVLDDFGLLPSLDTHLKSFAERHQIATSLSTDGLPERLPAEIETALYRITQEALTNVARHSQAAHVRVALAALGHELRLEIEDDGIGLPTNGTRTGTGLVGIRERARAIGGHLTVTSHPGVCVRIRLPLPPPTPPDTTTDPR